MRSYREAQLVADALADLGVLLKFACLWNPKAYKARQHTVAGLRKDATLIRLGGECIGRTSENNHNRRSEVQTLCRMA